MVFNGAGIEQHALLDPSLNFPKPDSMLAMQTLSQVKIESQLVYVRVGHMHIISESNEVPANTQTYLRNTIGKNKRFDAPNATASNS